MCMISQKNGPKSRLIYMRAILRSRLVFALYLWCHESLPHLLYPLHLLSIFSDMNTNNHVFDAIFFVTIRVFMQNVLQVLPSIYEDVFTELKRFPSKGSDAQDNDTTTQRHSPAKPS